MRGIDEERVTGWFEREIEGVEPPLEFALITGILRRLLGRDGAIK